MGECSHLMGADEGGHLMGAECCDHIIMDGDATGSDECGLRVIGGGVLFLPVGYRFLPTDEELVGHYLLKKMLNQPLLAPAIQDIDALELYSKSPAELDKSSCREEDMFFFIHHRPSKFIRLVGDKKGYWRFEGLQLKHFDGNLLASKSNFTYYSGMPSNGKKTNWVMEEYQLLFRPYVEEKREATTLLGRIKQVKEGPKRDGVMKKV